MVDVHDTNEQPIRSLSPLTPKQAAVCVKITSNRCSHLFEYHPLVEKLFTARICSSVNVTTMGKINCTGKNCQKDFVMKEAV